MVLSKSQEEKLKMKELKVLRWIARVKNEHVKRTGWKFWRHRKYRLNWLRQEQSRRQKIRGSVDERGLV